MTVTAEYAKQHLDELLKAAGAGEEVRIAGRGEATQFKLVAEPRKALDIRPRSEFFGSARGQVWMSEDFDSPEISEELADLFENGPLLPDENRQ